MRKFVPGFIVGLTTDLTAKAIAGLWGGGVLVALFGGVVWYFSKVGEADPRLRLALGTAFVLMLITVWLIGFLLVMRAKRPPPPARPAAPFVCSDGIRWVFIQRNYAFGTEMRPECCDHGTELKRRNPDGSLSSLGYSGHRAATVEGERTGHIPYCAHGHEVPYTRSANYEQARDLARILLDAKIRAG